MENYSIVLFILAIMIGLSAIAGRLRIPAPVLLITAGIAIGFIPALPDIELSPEVTFLIFLPPMLYDAAFNISFKDFRTNINTITTLAISLVFITASGIAVVAHYMIPGMSWPLSFVLGAILSATDAVAAISITKGLGLSHKVSTILEGESLVNDASALVAYRFAVAAVTGAAFKFWKASLQFAFLMAGGLLVGLVMGRLLAFVLKKVHHNPSVTISFMLLMPFVTYLVAEELHVSGVIAVVILGLSIARFSHMVFPPHLKLQSKSFWEIILFLLNGLIFILIGLQFPYVVKNIEKSQVLPYLGYALIITIAALVLRMARVFLQQVNLEKAFQKQTVRQQVLDQQLLEQQVLEQQVLEQHTSSPQAPAESWKNRRRNRRDRQKISEDALLDAKTSLIISWSGMRGIVSLAIAIGIPTTLRNGAPFPQRNAIIFISVAVVLFTILGQGLTLPRLVKWLNPTPTTGPPPPSPAASPDPAPLATSPDPSSDSPVPPRTPLSSSSASTPV